MMLEIFAILKTEQLEAECVVSTVLGKFLWNIVPDIELMIFGKEKVDYLGASEQREDHEEMLAYRRSDAISMIHIAAP